MSQETNQNENRNLWARFWICVCALAARNRDFLIPFAIALPITYACYFGFAFGGGGEALFYAISNAVPYVFAPYLFAMIGICSGIGTVVALITYGVYYKITDKLKPTYIELPQNRETKESDEPAKAKFNKSEPSETELEDLSQ